MAKRISVLVALDGADEGRKRAINSAERSLGDLASSAKIAGEKAAAGMAFGNRRVHVASLSASRPEARWVVRRTAAFATSIGPTRVKRCLARVAAV